MSVDIFKITVSVLPQSDIPRSSLSYSSVEEHFLGNFQVEYSSQWQFQLKNVMTRYFLIERGDADCQSPDT